jgi:hypothetical protein
VKYGEFSMALRYVAEHDHDLIQRILDWPLREFLLRYLHKLRQDALRNYELQVKIWAALVPHQDPKRRKKAPQLPRILKDE